MSACHKILYGLTLLTAIFGVYTKTAFAQRWERLPGAPAVSETDTIATDPEDERAVFIGSSGGLYGSWDGGENWKRLIGLRAGAKINRLYFEPGRAFLLTSDGLFQSTDHGQNWSPSFRGRNPRERNALAITRDPADPARLYLGTEGGLFVSEDSGGTWRQASGNLGRQAIQELKMDLKNRALFIAGDKGLYRAMNGLERLDRLYITRSSSETPDENEPIELEDPEPEKEDRVQAIAISPEPFSAIAIGTCRGVFMSHNTGTSWERITASGLRDACVRDLAFASHTKDLFAGTEKGVYRYNGPAGSWDELGHGLPAVPIHHLELGPAHPDTLYAATHEGAYRITIGAEIDFGETRGRVSIAHPGWDLARQLFQEEPSIGDIQKQAIRYANVDNSKTRRWHWGSRLKALVPSFSIGKGFSTSNNVDIDRGGTADPDRYIFGPDARSRDWDADLEWDLSELVWNSSQTSIDTREKLMVELRDDILSEITRLFFERRRSQIEFILKPPKDLVSRSQALVKIEELTAQIDAFTDGYLSQALTTLYSARPEFNTLWHG